MEVYIPNFDQSNLEKHLITLGSPIGVPSYAFRNWGITGDELKLRSMSEERYESEWKTGSPRQMQYVSDSIIRAGYGDFPQIVRNETGKRVSELMKDYDGRVNILDVGAGLSTVTIFDSLKEEDKNRIFLTLLEPSEERVENAAKKLTERGLQRNTDYKVEVGKDLNISSKLEPESQDIVTAVATIHHHAYLDKPFRIIYDVLNRNGHFITADWHNSMWEHPERVYKFLKEFDWLGKEKDLKKFENAYMKGSDLAPKLTGIDEYTNEMIRTFWKNWIQVRKENIEKGGFDSRDDIWMLEGHRPAERYVEDLVRAGFEIKGVYQILPDSRLLMRITSKKN
jgi:SAM-dependent methyltransferase